MRRFKWDREKIIKPKTQSASNDFIIKDNERGSRQTTLKARASTSANRRNIPVTLAGKYGTQGDGSQNNSQ